MKTALLRNLAEARWAAANEDGSLAGDSLDETFCSWSPPGCWSVGRCEVKLGLMNTFEWNGPGYRTVSREVAVEDLVAMVLNHLFEIACGTDNMVEVRYGEKGELYGITKRSRPEDLRGIAAELLEAEERGRLSRA